jgi:hypothetical protein
MSDLDKKALVEYELPVWAEYVSVDWIQTVIARYIAWKVNRKWSRLLKRRQRGKLLEILRREHPELLKTTHD